MTSKEKFKSLVTREKSNTVERNRERIINRARLRESQNIALKVLEKLDDLGWSQRKLADKMKVTPQQISKVVKGKENLTLETQIKLQGVLDIPILASYYEKKFDELVSTYTVEETEKYVIPEPQNYRGDERILYGNRSSINNYANVAEEYQPYELTA